KACLHGKHRHLAQSPGRTQHWLMPLRILPPPISRALIKDPIACLMSEYLSQQFGLTTIVLFRHPAGFVSSMIRLKWCPKKVLEQFLACEPLMAEWLAPFASCIESSKMKDPVESATALYGCLNTVLWG